MLVLCRRLVVVCRVLIVACGLLFVRCLRFGVWRLLFVVDGCVLLSVRVLGFLMPDVCYVFFIVR